VAEWVVTSLSALLDLEHDLHRRYAETLQVAAWLSRRAVSFQGNRQQPGYRWFKFREGFSADLVSCLLRRSGPPPGIVLDPFAGAGTTLFVAWQHGRPSLGIELLPIGPLLVEARTIVLGKRGDDLIATLDRLRQERPWKTREPVPFPHLTITRGAFPPETEYALGQFLRYADEQPDPAVGMLLRFAALCVLEEISYTEKAGQCLRWDTRSAHWCRGSTFTKKRLATFDEAIDRKLRELVSDAVQMRASPPPDAALTPHVSEGSSLEIVPTLAAESVAAVITSPPYLNRYDYTRTYALELALLGCDDARLRTLRQQLLSCTVENRPKAGLNQRVSPDRWETAHQAFAA